MKYLKICLFFVLLFNAILGAAPSLSSVQNNIYKASGLWDKDQAKAQQILKDAFAAAISWTRPEFIDSIREKAFYTAVSCYSPELATEAMLAADTYLKVFPKGRYLAKVQLFKAIAAFAEGKEQIALEALESARSNWPKALPYPEQTMFFNGYMSANHFRSAEKFIEGQRLVRPSGRLNKDLRRFHRGNATIDGLLQQIRDGRISGMAAAEKLEQQLQKNYFAKKAPEAALTSIRLKDNDRLAFNPVCLEWCGLKRAVKHSSSPQLREKKYRDFLQNFPQASAAETFNALLNLRYIYLFEIRDQIMARDMMERMKNVPGFAGLAAVEETIVDFQPHDIVSERGHKFLKELFESASLLPYDNGFLPVLERDYVEFLLAISEMALGRNSRLKVANHKGWNGLPADLLYAAATNNKDKAWEIFSAKKAELTPQVDRMLEDVVFPLYLPTPAGERYFLAGLAAIETLPDLGTDLIIRAISNNPRMYRVEHGLAVLADVYNRHLAYREAQRVWNLLSKLHPDSVWLK